jgi:XisH protein
MPAKDIYHETVKADLTKDGWTVTDDPLNLKIGTRNTVIDLGAEKIIATERDCARTLMMTLGDSAKNGSLSKPFKKRSRQKCDANAIVKLM